MNKQKRTAEVFDTQFQGTAPLNWCPQCGQQLITSQIGIGTDTTISGKMCKSCGYMHQPNVKSR